MNNFWKTFISSFLILLAAVLITGSPQKADATVVPPPTHGATIAKGCIGPKTIGDTTDCFITVGYNDAAGDTISVDEAWDVANFGGSNSRQPALGNLPIVSVSGNTTCTVAGALPCKIGKSGSVLSGLPGTIGDGSVTFESNTYVIQPGDPDPLPDQGNSKVHDLCDDPHTSGCSPLSNTLQFTSQTDIIHPHTTLTKTADPESGRAPLDVTYTYKEENDGDTAISNVVVSDDKCSPVTYQSGDANTNGLLDPGETWVFTCERTLSETTTNIATASGTVVANDEDAPKEEARATVKIINPHTTLTKTADKTSGSAPLAVTYTYKETNDGNDPISNVVLADDKCSPVTYQSGDTNNNGKLDPGETWVFTCKATLN